SPLDVGAAQDLDHFRVVQSGRHRRPKSRVVRIRTVSYDPGGPSVTLILGRLSTRKPLTLTATGLFGATGTPMPDFTTTSQNGSELFLSTKTGQNYFCPGRRIGSPCRCRRIGR